MYCDHLIPIQVKCSTKSNKDKAAGLFLFLIMLYSYKLFFNVQDYNARLKSPVTSTMLTVQKMGTESNYKCKHC